MRRVVSMFAWPITAVTAVSSLLSDGDRTAAATLPHRKRSGLQKDVIVVETRNMGYIERIGRALRLKRIRRAILTWLQSPSADPSELNPNDPNWRP
jgi:hypothetical protein